jgi:DNA-binding CsgD family transcriptional regulator/PAS domain-containing protein
VNHLTEVEFFDRLDEAVLDPTLWQPAMAALADLVGAGGSTLLSHSHSIDVWGRNDHPARSTFHARFIRNPIQDGIVQLRQSAVCLPKVVTDRQLIDRSDFVRTEFYNEFMRPVGSDTMTVVTLPSREGFAAINLVRSEKRGALSLNELHRLESLQPALARSLWLSVRLAGQRDIHRALADFFDQSPGCVFLVGRDAVVLRANPAAEALVRAGRGVSITGGRLRAATPHLTAQLHALIAAAASGAQQGACSMRIPTPTLRQPLSVLVSPVRSDRFADLWGGRSAIVCITDLEASISLPERRLAELFGLTAAETRTALALLRGATPREAADALGVSFNTIRNHLVRIFAKTDTHRQAELVRLLMRVVEQARA